MHERRNRRHPEWAEQERTGDLAWVGENLPILWRAAVESYVKFGKGLVVVDLTTTIMGGHPIFFVPAEDLGEGNLDEIRMLKEYDPDWELVVSLLKDDERSSTYRVGIPDRRPR